MWNCRSESTSECKCSHPDRISIVCISSQLGLIEFAQIYLSPSKISIVAQDLVKQLFILNFCVLVAVNPCCIALFFSSQDGL